MSIRSDSPHVPPRRLPAAPPGALALTTLALSGSVQPERLTRGAERLRALGASVSLNEAAFAEWRYFAGDDDARLAALREALAEPAPVVLFARGGYGLSRLLHRIDWQAVAASNKVFCGFSDVTAFSLAALAQANYVTFAGPVLAGEFAQDSDLDARAFTEQHFFCLLTADARQGYVYPECRSDLDYGHGEAEGTLWGTNLALIAHLAGTPWLPVIDDGILVLEDIGEAPYRVERMLWQLKHAGILDRQRAILLGQFTDCDPTPGMRYPYAMAEAIETLRAMVDCPVFTGFPFGHVPAKLTLPMGAPAALAWQGERYVLTVRDYMA